MNQVATAAYTITGMSCEHCRRAVIAEVGAIEGVEAVEIDLGSGRLEIRGEADRDAVAAAVEDAGYALAGGP